MMDLADECKHMGKKKKKKLGELYIYIFRNLNIQNVLLFNIRGVYSHVIGLY